MPRVRPLLVSRSGNTPRLFIRIDVGAGIAAPRRTHFLLIDQSRRAHAEADSRYMRSFDAQLLPYADQVVGYRLKLYGGGNESDKTCLAAARYGGPGMSRSAPGFGHPTCSYHW